MAFRVAKFVARELQMKVKVRRGSSMVRKREIGPVRTCVGCGQRDFKRRLFRMSIRPDGSVEQDGHSGRGGYLHLRGRCVEEFIRGPGKRRRRFGGALSMDARASIGRLIEFSTP